MPGITVNGEIGSGGPEIAADVARRLQFDYVDRLILAEAAKRLGATVEALAEKEQRVPTLGERIARFLQTIIERSAAAGAGGDPYFGPGIGILLGEEYPDLAREQLTSADQVHDQHFIEATQTVIRDLAGAGNAVINGRASNLILKDRPNTFHVGLVSSSMESRVKVIVNRLGITEEEAERTVIEHEKARVIYFQKFFNVSAVDATNFHIMLDTHKLGHDRAVSIVIQAAGL